MGRGGFHSPTVAISVVVVVILVNFTRLSVDFESRDGRIGALGERRWEKGEVDEQIAKQKRRVVRRDPQDVRQIYLRKPPSRQYMTGAGKTDRQTH